MMITFNREFHLLTCKMVRVLYHWSENVMFSFLRSWSHFPILIDGAWIRSFLVGWCWLGIVAFSFIIIYRLAKISLLDISQALWSWKIPKMVWYSDYGVRRKIIRICWKIKNSGSTVSSTEMIIVRNRNDFNSFVFHLD